MNRSRRIEAIVLKTNKIGDLHLGVTMLTPEDGLLQAIAHGANTPRGKLRGLVFPFAVGNCYLYTQPAKQSHKITDFELVQPLLGLRENLRRYYTASLWAESVLKSYATGGDAPSVFGLLHDSLIELNARAPEEADRVSIQFLWRFLGVNGRLPEVEYCVASGEELSLDDRVFYSVAEAGFCAEGYVSEAPGKPESGPDHPDTGYIEVHASAVRYLRHTSLLPFHRAITVIPAAETVPTIKRVIYAAVEDLLEQPLRTLSSGAGII